MKTTTTTVDRIFIFIMKILFFGFQMMNIWPKKIEENPVHFFGNFFSFTEKCSGKIYFSSKHYINHPYRKKNFDPKTKKISIIIFNQSFLVYHFPFDFDYFHNSFSLSFDSSFISPSHYTVLLSFRFNG